MLLCDTCKNRGSENCQKNATIDSASKVLLQNLPASKELLDIFNDIKENAEAEARRRGCPNI